VLGKNMMHALALLKQYAFVPPPFHTHHHQSLGTWLKLMLHRVILDEERTLYVDTDTLFQGSGAVQALWDASFNAPPLAHLAGTNEHPAWAANMSCSWMMRSTHLPGTAPCAGAAALHLGRMRGDARSFDGSFEKIAFDALTSLRLRVKPAAPPVASSRSWDAGPGLAYSDGEKPGAAIAGRSTLQ
jgi:hypothetical protein